MMNFPVNDILLELKRTNEYSEGTFGDFVPSELFMCFEHFTRYQKDQLSSRYISYQHSNNFSVFYPLKQSETEPKIILNNHKIS